MRAKAVASITDEFVPRALQGVMNASQRRQQNIHLTRFDLLDGSDVQVNQFRKPLLRQTFVGAFAPDICPELFELRSNLFGSRHSPLSRKNGVDLNGLLGRNLLEAQVPTIVRRQNRGEA